jgi:hypothetical protein
VGHWLITPYCSFNSHKQYNNGFRPIISPLLYFVGEED